MSTTSTKLEIKKSQKRDCSPQYSKKLDLNCQIISSDSKIIDCKQAIDSLENQVAMRTAELSSIIDFLNREISAHKQAQKTIWKSEKRYEELFNSVLAGIYINDKNETIQFCNPAFADIFEENSVTNLINKSLLDYLQKDQKQLVLSQTEHRKKNISSQYELGIITAKGNKKHLYVSVSPRFNQEGQYIGAFGSVIDITKRKRAEEEAYKFKTISDRANYGTAIVALEGNIIYINECFASMHGLTIEEAIGKHLSIFHTDKQMPEVNKLNKELIKNGYYPATEVWHKRKDGSVFPTMMNATIIKDENNKSFFISASAIDITDRKLAEIELQTAQHFSDSIIRSLPGLFYIFDKESIRFLRRNDSWCEITGYSDEELKTLTFFDFFTEGSEKDKCAVRVQEVYDTGYSTMENNLLTKSGEKIPYYFTGRRVVIDGKTYLAGMAIDITKRKRAEERLRESEEKYSKVANYSYDWEYWVNPKGKFIYVSPSCKRITGYSADEFLQNPKLLLSIVHSDDVNLVKNHKHKSRKSGEPIPLEFRIITKSGKERWIGHVCQTVYDNNGLDLGQRGCNRDITKRKLNEIRLKESEDKFRGLSEQSPNMIFINCLGKFVYANRRCEEVMEYTKDELYSSDFDFHCVIAPESLDELNNRFNKYLEGIESPPMEYAILTKSGKRIEVILSTKLISYKGDSAVLGIITDITKYKEAEKSLIDLNIKLEAKQSALIGKHIALKEVLDLIEDDKKEIAVQIQTNIDKTVMPILGRLMERANPEDKKSILLLKNSMEQITHPFVGKLESQYGKLTPREAEISNMIKIGLSTKDIAQTLNTSWETVRNQRKQIRKKLNISGKKVSLTSFLQTT